MGSVVIFLFYCFVFLHCRFGIETLWNFMREMNVTPDAELEAKVSIMAESKGLWGLMVLAQSSLISRILLHGEMLCTQALASF